MALVLPKFPTASFLCDARAYDIDASGQIIQNDESTLSELAMATLASRMPEIATDGDSTIGAAISIPVFRAGRIVSVVVLCGRNNATGVFEIWEPTGPYEELRLRCGYFGQLDRFQNVSSFIRFEKGAGLPGQVWRSQRAVVHDDLANHPGFLRAAGASAESLQTAIGIPVASDEFVAVVVLISAATTRIARGFEVWEANADGFTLSEAKYSGLAPGLELPLDTKMSTNGGLPGLANEHGGATTTEHEMFLYAQRDPSCADLTGALAIPFYESDTLTSITSLLF